MKRRLAMFLAVMLLFGLCAAVPAEDARQKTLFDQAERLSQALVDGDAAPFGPLMTEDLRAAITDEALIKLWAQNTAPLGARQGTLGMMYAQDDNSVMVEVIHQFDKAAFVLRFVFVAGDKLGGLWMRAEDLNKAQETLATAAIKRLGVLTPDAPTATLSEGVAEQDITVGDGGLPGLLTYPLKDRKPITALLVAGSGPQDRDETIGPSKLLRDLAWHLAGQGITSLRYDKRTLVYPEQFGRPEDTTIQREVLDDVKAAVALLGGHALTENDRVFVIGHSLGGMLVPAILADNPDLAGAVVLAGSPRSLWDIMADQNKDALAASGLDKAQADAQLASVLSMVQQAKALTAGKGEQLLGMPDHYVASINRLGLADAWQGIDKPLLILQGHRDFQVYVDRDFAAFQKLLSEHQNVTLKAYPGLDHLFMQAVKGDMTDYMQPRRMETEVLDDIAQWLMEKSP